MIGRYWRIGRAAWLLGAIALIVEAFAASSAIAQPAIPRPAQPIPIGTPGQNAGLPKSISNELGVFPQNEYDELYTGLHDICPCFFIRIVEVTRGEGGPRNKRQGGDIIIRHPGDTADLSADIRNFQGRDVVKPKRNVRSAIANVQAADFCDCYKRYRAGCNLVWKIATAPTPPTLWKRGLGETSAATPGHVGWNSGDADSGKSQRPNSKGELTDDTTTDRRPSIGLAHELAHAYNSIYGQTGSSNPREDNFEEFKATRMENQIRDEMRADAVRDRGDRSNSTLGNDDIYRLGPRIEYNPGQTVPGHSAGTIPMGDLFDCPKEVGFIPGYDGDNRPGQTPSSGMLANCSYPGVPSCVTTSMSVDTQAYCTYGSALPSRVLFAPTDASGKPLTNDVAISKPDGPRMVRDPVPQLSLLTAPSGAALAPPQLPNRAADRGSIEHNAPAIASPTEPRQVVTPQSPAGLTPLKAVPPSASPRPTEPQQASSEPANPQQPPAESGNPQRHQPTPESKPNDSSAPPASDRTGSEEVTIFIKATDFVLQGQPPGAELKEQLVKLVALKEPALPKTGASKPQDDNGFDRSPVTCTTRSDGQCQATIPLDEGGVYGFPANGPRFYRTDLTMRRNAGAVIDQNGASQAALALAPYDSAVSKTDFKIGDKTFTRIAVNAPDNVANQILEKLKKSLGSKVQEDYCAEKKPGPPLGMDPVSYSALGSELPRISIRLEGVGKRRERRP